MNVNLRCQQSWSRLDSLHMLHENTEVNAAYLAFCVMAARYTKIDLENEFPDPENLWEAL